MTLERSVWTGERRVETLLGAFLVPMLLQEFGSSLVRAWHWLGVKKAQKIRLSRGPTLRTCCLRPRSSQGAQAWI